MLDAEAYPSENLAERYFRRWEVELDFRHVKTTMQMDVPRGKSPDIVRKEIWTHLLAYNPIRSVMHAAAAEHEAPPRRLSLKGTQQHLIAHRDLVCVPAGRQRGEVLQGLLALIARNLVPHRPHRAEPRVRKRRPKSYPLMTKPRADLAAEHVTPILRHPHKVKVDVEDTVRAMTIASHAQILHDPLKLLPKGEGFDPPKVRQ